MRNAASPPFAELEPAAPWFSDGRAPVLFRGGPYIDNRYFGEGIGIAVRKGNDAMRLTLNWALFRIWEQGRFTDLWLRYFPISPF